MSDGVKILDKRPSPGGLEILKNGAGAERNAAPGASKRAAGGNVAEGFPHWQSRVAVALGVSEDMVREARADLTEGVDWCHQGQRVLFSDQGRERLVEALKLFEKNLDGGGGDGDPRNNGDSACNQSVLTDGGVPRLEPVKPSDSVLRGSEAEVIQKTNAQPVQFRPAVHPPVVVSGPVSLRVVQVPVNPRLVLCVPTTLQGMPQAGAERVRVKVRSNVNFIPGMLLKAEAIAGLPGMFSLVGACPRFRGRF